MLGTLRLFTANCKLSGLNINTSNHTAYIALTKYLLYQNFELNYFGNQRPHCKCVARVLKCSVQWPEGNCLSTGLGKLTLSNVHLNLSNGFSVIFFRVGNSTNVVCASL